MPEVLTLEEANLDGRKQKSYKLRSMIEHKKVNWMSGHYKAYCKWKSHDQEAIWRACDGRVIAIVDINITKVNPYIVYEDENAEFD